MNARNDIGLLHVVHLEDEVNDQALVQAALEAESIACEIEVVNSQEKFVAALARGADLILSDFSLPGFDGLGALGIARRMLPDVPFIFVSGAMGEEAAIESLKKGATDYVLKHRLGRLGSAVRRALIEAVERRTRRQAEEMLEREQQFLRAVVESLEVAVMACNPEGAPVLFNRAYRELYGPPDEHLPTHTGCHHQLYSADGETPLENNAVPINRALHGERFRNVEIIIVPAGGSAHSALVSGQPIVDGRGNSLGAVVAAQDISDLRQLEKQFRQVQKMEAMGQLAAGVAHDFNNLLTVILGYSDLLCDRLAPDDPALASVEEIGKAGRRAEALTRQLLAFSRHQVLQPSVLDLNRVITEMQQMLKKLITADIELSFAMDRGLGCISADSGQMEQILLNLIVNARDAISHKGRITVETANIDIGADGNDGTLETAVFDGSGSQMQPGSYVALTVTDSGCGMNSETLSRIFEPFFTTKGPGAGTGLGLSTVLGIVKQSEGHIAVRSESGKGTTLRVYLPRVVGEKESPKPAEPEPVQVRGGETILLVDDEDALRGIVSEILRVNGYSVLEAATGDAALVIAESDDHRIDAMITDVVMPKMGGLELAERLEGLRPNLPTLFMSGYVGKGIASFGTGLRPGVSFIQKPFTPEALLLKLREVLDRTSAQAA